MELFKHKLEDFAADLHLDGVNYACVYSAITFAHAPSRLYRFGLRSEDRSRGLYWAASPLSGEVLKTVRRGEINSAYIASVFAVVSEIADAPPLLESFLELRPVEPERPRRSIQMRLEI